MAKFADLTRTIKALAKVPSQVAKGAALEIAAAIDAEFDAGLDPYGQPWEPLAEATVARGRFAPPLTDTRTMRDSVQVKPMPGAGISVTFDDPSTHHQYGTKSMAARPVFPNHGLPDTWQRAIADAAEAAFEKAGGGRG